MIDNSSISYLYKDMGILDALFNTKPTIPKDARCCSCHKKIKSHEDAYIRYGKVYCKKCAEEEDFWDELDLLDDIFDEE